MTIEIPTLEILFLLFSFYAFKWLFRILVLMIISKLISSLKEKGSTSLKDFQEKMTKGEY